MADRHRYDGSASGASNRLDATQSSGSNPGRGPRRGTGAGQFKRLAPEPVAPPPAEQAAPRPEPAPIPVEPVAVVATTPPSEAKRLLYHHESGNDPTAINPTSGACGIGQALPCSKLPCELGDYACQDAWFTDYMTARYGSWEAAWNYWNCIGQCTNNYGTIYKSATWW